MSKGLKALYFEEQNIGARVKSSKKKYTWRFSIETREFTLDLYVSRMSGKVKVLLDGEIKYQGKRAKNTTFSYPFRLGRHQCMIMQIGENYDLRLDNLAFQQLYMESRYSADDQDNLPRGHRADDWTTGTLQAKPTRHKDPWGMEEEGPSERCQVDRDPFDKESWAPKAHVIDKDPFEKESWKPKNTEIYSDWPDEATPSTKSPDRKPATTGRISVPSRQTTTYSEPKPQTPMMRKSLGTPERVRSNIDLFSSPTEAPSTLPTDLFSGSRPVVKAASTDLFSNPPKSTESAPKPFNPYEASPTYPQMGGHTGGQMIGNPMMGSPMMNPAMMNPAMMNPAMMMQYMTWMMMNQQAQQPPR
jgi:hypothetical protein